MNFLAHIYLSGNDEDLMIGNFIADYVKGQKKFDYPDGIRKGIELHRQIDFFTDHHPVTGRSKIRLRPRYGKYSGVIVDLYYDHFLAKFFEEYSTETLASFSRRTYEILTKRRESMPDEVNRFLPFMIERNWLLNYATIEGIDRTLTGLSKRVNFQNRMDEAINDLKGDYTFFETDFREFFPELINFAQTWK